MKAFTVAAIFGAAALAAPNPDKTVFQTEEVTITSCGPEVTNCPASSAATQPATTPVASVPASSNVEGVTSAPSAPAPSAPAGESPAPSAPAGESPAPSAPAVETPAGELSTSTIYSTLVSSGAEGVVTQTIAVSTTICPVTATQTPGAPAETPVTSGVEGSSPNPSDSAPPAAGTPAVPAAETPVTSGVEGSAPKPSVPAGGSSTNTCEPIISTSTIYMTPGVPSQPAGTGYVPYPTGGPYASSAVAGTPGVPVTPTTPAGTPGSTPAATPPSFTGAANSLNAAGAFAGFGALAAFFF